MGCGEGRQCTKRYRPRRLVGHAERTAKIFFGYYGSGEEEGEDWKRML